MYMRCGTQELKKKEMEELDALFGEMGVAVEDKKEEQGEGKKKKKVGLGTWVHGAAHSLVHMCVARQACMIRPNCE